MNFFYRRFDQIRQKYEPNCRQSVGHRAFLHGVAGSCLCNGRVSDVSYPNRFVTQCFGPGVNKRVGVRYLWLGLGLVPVLGLGVSV